MYEMLAIFGYHSWERSAASLIYSDLLNLLSSASSTSQEIRNSELVVVFLSIKWLYIITVTHIYTSKKEIFKRKLWFGVVVVIEMLLEWWLSYQKTEYMFKRNICVHFDNNDNCSNLHKVGFCFDLQILCVCYRHCRKRCIFYTRLNDLLLLLILLQNITRLLFN